MRRELLLWSYLVILLVAAVASVVFLYRSLMLPDEAAQIFLWQCGGWWMLSAYTALLVFKLHLEKHRERSESEVT